MAVNDLLSEDNLDLLPGPEATAFRSEVVSPQHQWRGDPMRGAEYTYGPTVPSREPINDIQLTGLFTHDAAGVASRYGVHPSIAPFPSAGAEDDNGMRMGRAHMQGLLRAQKAYAMNLATRDPQAAGVALADMDGMRDGFNALVAEGYTFISVGAGNTYGHPTQEVLQRLDNHGITVYRTDQDGTVELRIG